MKQARLIVPILIAVAVMSFMRRPASTVKTTAEVKGSPNRPSRSASKDWLPLNQGNVWEYRVSDSDRLRTYSWKVARSHGSIHEVLESANGRQIGTYSFDCSDPGLRLRPFAMSTKIWQYLPPDLEVGVRWALRKGWRATAEGEEEIPLPGGRSATALRIRYEAEYDADVTRKPGWYFDGKRWFVRGIGIVREDHRGVEVPPDMPRPKRPTGGYKELVFFRVE